MNEELPLEPDAAETVVTTQSAPRAEEVVETKTRRQPPYNVIVLNDEDHTFEYVIGMLMKLFGHSMATSEELAHRIDKEGRAIVYTTHLEKAELKCDQVITYGPDPRNEKPHGPLGCYIEPAPGA
ncbi:ATP-dependent Clp protease adaptor ClpS [Singulisphaera sp. PoT]|uniref:ATP-dependent Clp protease adaptor ClpS n=1 Tax=Singulisphaera sp. PoT TaxID=3411797 RepID=UPI003BF5B384